MGWSDLYSDRRGRNHSPPRPVSGLQLSSSRGLGGSLPVLGVIQNQSRHGGSASALHPSLNARNARQGQTGVCGKHKPAARTGVMTHAYSVAMASRRWKADGGGPSSRRWRIKLAHSSELSTEVSTSRS